MIDMENKYNIDPKEYGFNTIKEMCKAHGVKESTFFSRISSGYSVNEALNGRNKCKDYLGKEYKNRAEMCRAYNISYNIFMRRINNGYSLERALTDPCKNNENSANQRVRDYTDNDGNKYTNASELCKAKGININTFRYRMRQGDSVDEAIQDKEKNSYLDHLGNEFETKSKMCECYNISVNTLNNRLKSGWTLKNALTKGIRSNKIKEICQRYGYENLSDMCKHFKVDYKLVNKRVNGGWELIPALISPAYEVSLGYIRLDGKTAYKVTWSENPVTTIELILHYNKELLGLYRKGNPEDKWQPLV